MIVFQRPSDDSICQHLRRLAAAPFNYDAVGCLDRGTPTGFRRDQATFVLGTGEADWLAARKAIESWAMFPRDMVSMVRLSDKIETGTVVAVLCKVFGLWTISPARVFSTVDQKSAVHRFGFTYGTLPGHVESGEESFAVSWDRVTDRVCYEVQAVSRPNHILCWLGYPFTRRMQARFRKLSGESMQAFVQRQTATDQRIEHSIGHAPAHFAAQQFTETPTESSARSRVGADSRNGL